MCDSEVSRWAHPAGDWDRAEGTLRSFTDTRAVFLQVLDHHPLCGFRVHITREDVRTQHHVARQKLYTGSPDRITVADVSGHGLPAALIASMVKAALAAQALTLSTPAGIGWIESVFVRKLPASLRDGNLRIHRHGREVNELRWRRTSATPALERIN